MRAGDTLSGGVMAQIYDALYEYKYLVRPYELKPALAAALPQVSADGLTYTIPLKKGVVFQDDPCFKATGGHGREVTADDIIYGIKRLMDVANKPTGSWMLQGKVVGLDEFYDESVKRAAAGEDMDYSMPVAGLQAPDPYTLRIQLKERYPQLKYALAMPYTAPVPHEAVEVYPDDFVNHPVGTGAFRLKEWTKRWRMILERNPTYRDDRYPGEGEPGDREAGLLDAAGERLPIVDEIYLSIVSEAQPAWLLFKEGYLDASGISKDNFKEAISPVDGADAGLQGEGHHADQDGRVRRLLRRLQHDGPGGRLQRQAAPGHQHGLLHRVAHQEPLQRQGHPRPGADPARHLRLRSGLQEPLHGLRPEEGRRDCWQRRATRTAWRGRPPAHHHL